MTVVRWHPVAQRWWGHRPEPLLMERMWGCPTVLGPGDPRPTYAGEAGFDAEGRPVAYRNVEGAPEELVVHEGRRVTMTHESGVTVTTTLDEDGRPRRTEYTGRGAPSPETYRYDAAGRLVEIVESDGLWGVCFGERYQSGGRLSVEHDDLGPVRIVGDVHGVVWERAREPWPDTLQAGAATVADAALVSVARACAELGVQAGTEVFGLCLTYVAQGGLLPTLSFGLESDRRAWRAEGRDGERMAIDLLYLHADGEGLNVIDDELLHPEADEALLRAACIAQPYDPYRVVLTEAARLLARATLPVVSPTDDFVVFIAEHDEGIREKTRSIAEVNPPDRVARWRAGFPDPRRGH